MALGLLNLCGDVAGGVHRQCSELASDCMEKHKENKIGGEEQDERANVIEDVTYTLLHWKPGETKDISQEITDLGEILGCPDIVSEVKKRLANSKPPEYALRVRVCEAKEINGRKFEDGMRFYATVQLQMPNQNGELFHTGVCEGCQPVWNKIFNLPLKGAQEESLVVSLWNHHPPMNAILEKLSLQSITRILKKPKPKPILSPADCLVGQIILPIKNIAAEGSDHYYTLTMDKLNPSAPAQCRLELSFWTTKRDTRLGKDEVLPEETYSYVLNKMVTHERETQENYLLREPSLEASKLLHLYGTQRGLLPCKQILLKLDTFGQCSIKHPQEFHFLQKMLLDIQNLAVPEEIQYMHSALKRLIDNLLSKLNIHVNQALISDGSALPHLLSCLAVAYKGAEMCSELDPAVKKAAMEGSKEWYMNLKAVHMDKGHSLKFMSTITDEIENMLQTRNDLQHPDVTRILGFDLKSEIGKNVVQLLFCDIGPLMAEAPKLPAMRSLRLYQRLNKLQKFLDSTAQPPLNDIPACFAPALQSWLTEWKQQLLTIMKNSLAEDKLEPDVQNAKYTCSVRLVVQSIEDFCNLIPELEWPASPNDYTLFAQVISELCEKYVKEMRTKLTALCSTQMTNGEMRNMAHQIPTANKYCLVFRNLICLGSEVKQLPEKELQAKLEPDWKNLEAAAAQVLKDLVQKISSDVQKHCQELGHNNDMSSNKVEYQVFDSLKFYLRPVHHFLESELTRFLHDLRTSILEVLNELIKGKEKSPQYYHAIAEVLKVVWTYCSLEDDTSTPSSASQLQNYQVLEHSLRLRKIPTEMLLTQHFEKFIDEQDKDPLNNVGNLTISVAYDALHSLLSVKIMEATSPHWACTNERNAWPNIKLSVCPHHGFPDQLCQRSTSDCRNACISFEKVHQFCKVSKEMCQQPGACLYFCLRAQNGLRKTSVGDAVLSLKAIPSINMANAEKLSASSSNEESPSSPEFQKRFSIQLRKPQCPGRVAVLFLSLRTEEHEHQHVLFHSLL
uniref:BAI1-associated protein 3-like isoform X2 n=1 Tax=Myxine glutinosa TaxID=7769 RepID=UPI0035900994